MLAWQIALEECYCEHTWLLPHLDVSSYYKMYLIYRHAVFFLGLLVGQKKAIAFAQLWGPGVSWKHQKGRNRKQNNKSKPQQQQSRLSFYHYPCATSCPALTKTWFRKPLNTLPHNPIRSDTPHQEMMTVLMQSYFQLYVVEVSNLFWSFGTSRKISWQTITLQSMLWRMPT